MFALMMAFQPLNGRQDAQAAGSPLPVATIDAPAAPFFNEPFQMSVTFDNASVTDTGFGPYVDLELPPSITFSSASYFGAGVVTTGPITCAVANTFGHPLTGQTRPCTSGNTIYVLEAPFGSFAPDQPPAKIDISAAVGRASPR